VTDTLDGAALNDANTISGEGASSIVVIIGSGLVGAGFLAFEGTVDGTVWIGVPVVQYYSASATTLPNHFDEKTLLAFTAGTFKFLQPGYRSYRVRVATAGSAGSATAVMNASAAATTPVDVALYFAGSQPFDLTIPANTVTVNTKGAGMFALTWSATLGSSTVTPTAGGAALECYSLGHASDNSRSSWTGAVQGITWACPLYGATSVALTKDVGIGSGSSTVSFFVSMSSSVPNETRPVTQWVAGSSPTSVLVGSPKPLLNPEGRQAVVLDHPRWFQCAMTSTATAATVITTCSGAVATLAAPGAGLRFYITDFSYSSSIISTTANFMTLRYGTGGTCGTGTTSLWVGSNAPAFSPREPTLGPNGRKAGVNAEVCFIHPGAGTRNGCCVRRDVHIADGLRLGLLRHRKQVAGARGPQSVCSRVRGGPCSWVAHDLSNDHGPQNRGDVRGRDLCRGRGCVKSLECVPVFGGSGADRLRG
jgi:hypothetical protein